MKHNYSMVAINAARKALEQSMNHTTAYYNSLEKAEQKFYRTILFARVYEYHVLMMDESVLYGWKYKTAKTYDERHNTFLKIMETRKAICGKCNDVESLKCAFSNV